METQLKNIEFVNKVKIDKITTFKTKGYVKGVFYPKTQNEFIKIYNYLKNQNIPFDIIGNGSNILFTNKSKDIILISTKKIRKNIKINGNYIFLQSSVMLSYAYKIAKAKGLSGFEYLATIPATIGGAIKMNAGAFGKCIFDYLEKIKIYCNGKIKFLTKEQIIYDYRYTNLNDCLILSAKFKLEKMEKSKIYNQYIQCLNFRKENQPSEFSAGCIFKNPPNISAGYLIDKCNLKGIHKNNAQISNKHGNIIINNGKASYKDIIYLINLCKNKVKEKFGIELELEIKII